MRANDYKKYKGKPVGYSRLLKFLEHTPEIPLDMAYELMDYPDSATKQTTMSRLLKDRKLERFTDEGHNWIRAIAPRVKIAKKVNERDSVPDLRFDSFSQLGMAYIQLVSVSLNSMTDPELRIRVHVIREKMRKWFVLQEDRQQFYTLCKAFAFEPYGKTEMIDAREKLIRLGWITREQFDEMNEPNLDWVDWLFDSMKEIS